MIRRLLLILLFIFIVYIVKKLFGKKNKNKKYSVLGEQKRKNKLNVTDEDIIEVSFREKTVNKKKESK